jgi:hypothetical protein
LGDPIQPLLWFQADQFGALGGRQTVQPVLKALDDLLQFDGIGVFQQLGV